MTELKTVLVTIGGKQYTVRGDANEDYIRQLARFVDERMRGVTAQLGTGPTIKAAVMAALQIADEFHQMKALAPTQMKEVGDKLDRTLLRLEEALTTD